MSRQLAHLIALGLADWFIDEADDPRFYEINNIDPDRFGQCSDPFELAAAREEHGGRPLVFIDDPPDALDELIRAALAWPYDLGRIHDD